MTATRRATDTLIIAAVVLAVWKILHEIAGSTALPAPLATMAYLVHMVPTARFAENAAATLKAFSLALLLAYGIGLAIGVWMGAHRLSGAVGEPILVVIYSLPKITLYPVLIAIFGLSPIPIVLIGVATAVVAMVIATLNGLDRVPRVLTKVARVHRLDAVTTAMTLQLPAAAPYLFTGVKLSVSYGFIAVIAAEFILSPAGLGRDIADAYSDFNNRRMYALILFLLIIATVVNTVLHALDVRWAERRSGDRT